MSTFDGLVLEFPDIRVDYFRNHPGLRPPLACFLSHVHSDHLAGLETLKSPFVYCSAATKQLLLRLERYPHRLNLARGILESRKQQYKHLKNLLKPVPLETPTRIELTPGHGIQVTLFDANHCTGAVMFLIEGSGHAILYTGDIRSEPWFVNSLTRNPFLIEFVSGLRKLDCIYLDTTNTDTVDFPTKADGLKELLQKVSQYAADTTFHFTAWTFGYEQVWMALSRALNSAIHVDNYKLRLYQSLYDDCTDRYGSSGSIIAHEGPALAGYTCGNTRQPGCLTNDSTVRLHSCEIGMHCGAINDETVWIEPIVARTRLGAEIVECGLGGGGSDLNPGPELELDSNDMIEHIIRMIAKPGSSLLSEVKQILHESFRSNRKMLFLDGVQKQDEEISIVDLLEVIARLIHKKRSKQAKDHGKVIHETENLPKTITFPYSRHSSLAELRHLVSIFKPKDIYPCTVNEQRWHEGVSMKALFGDVCSPESTFRHDSGMRQRLSHAEQQLCLVELQTQTTDYSSQSSRMHLPSSPPRHDTIPTPVKGAQTHSSVLAALHHPKRNDAGMVDAHDLHSNELADPKPSISQDGFGISPGSASQNLRRKAIFDDLEQTPPKRACKRSPFGRANSVSGAMDGTTLVEQEQSVSLSLPPVSLGAYQCNEKDKDVIGMKYIAQGNHNSEGYTARGKADSEPDGHEINDQRDGGEQEETDESELDVYWDAADQVFRHSECGYETWDTTKSTGFCVSCNKGPTPYWVDGMKDRHQRVYLSEYHENQLAKEAQDELLNDFLDDNQSAYDTQDEQSVQFTEDYEQNSFIDDQSSSDGANISPGGDGVLSEGEIDLDSSDNDLETGCTDTDNAVDLEEQNYASLLVQHARVADANSDSLSEMSVSEDNDDVSLVHVSVQDPIVTEVVLSRPGSSPTTGTSEVLMANSVEAAEAVLSHWREEQTDEARLHDRLKAANAAVEEAAWHSISLTSITGNHTWAEVEL